MLNQDGTLIVISRNGMGEGPPELREQLLGTWLKLVQQDGRLPGAVALYAEGTFLATRESPVLEALKELEGRGVHVILCRTCIDHFDLADRIAVGVVGGMGDILAAQWSARKVISL